LRHVLRAADRERLHVRAHAGARDRAVHADQRVDELVHRLEALARILVHALRDDLGDAQQQRPSRLARALRDRLRRRRDVLGEDAHERLALERQRAGEALVHDHAHRVDVRTLIDGVSERLLRRHVERRAEDRAGAGQVVLAVVAGDLRDTEVEQLRHVVRRVSLLRDEDVLGLHVAMGDALGVRCREAVTGLDEDVEQTVRVHRLLDHFVQRCAVEKLHAHVDATVGQPPEVLDADDVAVLDRRRGARLLLEPLHGLAVRDDLGLQQLDRELFVDVDVVGGVDLAHSALAELLEDLVPTVQHLTDQ
jgi:hypothetical protein